MLFQSCILLFFAKYFAKGFQDNFWNICDLHLDISGNSINSKNIGNYKSDSTILLIKSTFQQMKKIYPNPRFIILNGDYMHHENGNLNKTLITIINELNQQFPGSDILPSLGDHDVDPKNILLSTSKWCETFYNFWKISLKKLEEPDILTFKKGCFYSQHLLSLNGSLDIIVLNTLLWYRRNIYTSDESDPGEQFAWLKNKLEYARRRNSKVFLVGHIPPGSSEYSSKTVYHFHNRFNDILLHILLSYSNTIDAGFFAHQHTDAFKIVYNLKGMPVVPIFHSPSVTPFYLKNIGSVNPSIRLYKWRNTNDQSKYIQYHANIFYNKSSLKKEFNWSLEYDSLELMPGLSAGHLHQLVSDFEKNNSVYFDKVFRFHLSGRNHDDFSCPTNSSCRCKFICGVKNINYSNLSNCLKKCSSYNYTFITILSVIIVILFIFFLICLILQ